MSSSQKEGISTTSYEREISLIDILLFLKKTWKIIAIAGVLGALVAIAYLSVTPNRYEAVAQIQMARVPAEKNLLGANVEEPAALISRMSLPTSINDAVISACGLQNSTSQANELGKAIKLSIPKGVASVVELKVTRPTAELAKACAGSVVDLITQSQAKMIGPMADSAKTRNAERLATVDERLAQDKLLLAKAEQPKGTVSAAYFAILTEIRALEDERGSLSKMVGAQVLQEAALQSPIFVADQPVYPKKTIALAMGLAGGLFLGVLIALGKRMFATIKSQMQGIL